MLGMDGVNTKATKIIGILLEDLLGMIQTMETQTGGLIEPFQSGLGLISYILPPILSKEMVVMTTIELETLT